MKETERQVFYNLCTKYVMNMITHKEAIVAEDKELYDKTGENLKDIENSMLKYLKEDS